MRTYLVTAWVFVVTAVSSVALAMSLPCSPNLQVSCKHVAHNTTLQQEAALIRNGQCKSLPPILFRVSCGLAALSLCLQQELGVGERCVFTAGA